MDTHARTHPDALPAPAWNAYLQEARFEFLRLWRSPSFSLPVLLFPPLFYLLFGEIFGGNTLVAHVCAAFQAVELGDLQRFLGQIDTRHVGTSPRHRFGEDPAATADVEYTPARQRCQRVDPVQTQRIDFMQRTEL